MSEWISVNDLLPEIGIRVLCYRPMASESNDDVISPRIYRGEGYRNQSWQGVIFHFDGCCHVTHWMPLPEPPEQGK